MLSYDLFRNLTNMVQNQLAFICMKQQVKLNKFRARMLLSKHDLIKKKVPLVNDPIGNYSINLPLSLNPY